MALVRLLGPVDVLSDDGSERQSGSALRRTILALLGLHAGQVLSPDWLMEHVWGDDQPESGVPALRFHVSKLRKEIGNAVPIVTRPGGYQMDVPRASVDALRWLAEVDAREIHHDVVRMLSCPSARLAGLDHVIDHWQAQGQLPTRGLAFGVFGALHPTSLGSPLAQRLEAQGHRARAGLGAYEGELPSGFDLALRSADRDALDWWFARVPGLVNRVPPRQGNQMPWLPLARVLTPSYLAQPQQQREMVAYLLARGADPWRTLPHDPGTTVVAYAWQLNSPLVALLDPVPQKKPQAGAGVAGAMVAGPANSMP